MHLSRVLPLLVSFAAYAAGSAAIKRQASSTSSGAAPTTTLTADNADEECTHTSTSRACWGNGFSIATDFDKKWPDTGKTVRYTLDITNTTLNPDGTGDRMAFLVNGKYPGDTIRASWGDHLEITVNNHLEYNGTGIHWHALRQLNTCDQDGVPGVTECPIAPGESRVYRFHATQYGTSWYHSHWSVQYGQGVLGPIVIDGPATENYDEDLGTFALTDWYELTAFANAHRARARPPQAYNGLINGKNINPNDESQGERYKTTIKSGKKYRVRIINTSVDNGFMVSLDNHPFTVITSDFVPVMPYVAKRVFVGIGQRLDVIIEANQTASNYWFRADVPAATLICGSNAMANNIKAIFHYENATNADPTSEAWEATGLDADRCRDESYGTDRLEPYWDSFVPDDALTANPSILDVEAFDDGVAFDNVTRIFRWGVNLSSLRVDWDRPTLQYVQDGNTSYPDYINLIPVPDNADWTYWVLQEQGALLFPHPIHLHGHDFYVLGAQENSQYTNDMASSLNFVNPPRRDTAMLPTGGWLVLAFETNNPGAWIMHCHIAWHVADGLAAQFLESPSQVSLAGDFNDICSKWKDFYPEDSPYKQDDSGV